VRQDVLRRYGPALRLLLDSITRELEADDLIALNRSVDLGDEDPRSAALGWLRSHGFAT
jgi:glycine betaine/choline ABC-type transport system substrate-binding protein